MSDYTSIDSKFCKCGSKRPKCPYLETNRDPDIWTKKEPKHITKCLNKIDEKSKLFNSALEVACILVKIMMTLSIQECKAKKAIDIIIYSFMHYKTQTSTCSTKVRRFINKDQLYCDLRKIADMTKCEARLTSAIVSSSFKAFYYKQRIDFYDEDYVSKNKWREVSCYIVKAYSKYRVSSKYNIRCMAWKINNLIQWYVDNKKNKCFPPDFTLTCLAPCDPETTEEHMPIPFAAKCRTAGPPEIEGKEGKDKDKDIEGVMDPESRHKEDKDGKENRRKEGSKRRSVALKEKDGTDEGKEETDEGKDGTDEGKDGTDKGKDGTDKGKDGTDKGKDGTDKGKDGTDKGKDGTDKEKYGSDEEEDGTDEDETDTGKHKEGRRSDKSDKHRDKDKNEKKFHDERDKQRESHYSTRSRSVMTDEDCKEKLRELEDLNRQLLKEIDTKDKQLELVKEQLSISQLKILEQIEEENENMEIPLTDEKKLKKKKSIHDFRIIIETKNLGNDLELVFANIVPKSDLEHLEKIMINDNDKDTKYTVTKKFISSEINQ